MQDKTTTDSPYLTAEEAARFCRVCLRTFKAYAKKYQIPRHGPGRNKYTERDLLSFMAEPECFIMPKPLPRHANRKFTPVRI